MPDQVHTIGKTLPTEFDRRAFFTKIGLGSLGIAAAGTVVFSYEYLSPNVLYLSLIHILRHPHEIDAGSGDGA